MKTNILLLGLLLLLVVALTIVPTVAQEDDIPNPGEGGAIIYPNLGNDIATLNPIVNSDGSSNRVISRLFPTFIGVDPDSANFAPNVPASLVTGWEISDDGLVYTFSLRDDWAWSDGVPITANDYAYSFEAIQTIETPLGYVLADMQSVRVVDDYTIEITLNSPSCGAIVNISSVPVVPSHIYSERFPEFADMIDAPDNLGDPGATAQRWMFQNFRPGEQVTLLADQNYPDAQAGYVIPEGWVYRNIADQTLIVENFLAGEISIVGSVPADRKSEIRDLAANGGAQIYETPSTSVRFISFNEADPANPQAGLDEDGNAIDQGHHPILGDVRVRQALMHAMDWEGINIGALAGEEIQLASHWLPNSWAFNPDIPFYEYDLDLARQLLDEAGWIDDDNDESTPRVAQGALYAEDGTTLSFELLTNAGNTENESIGLLLTDMWADVGFELDFQPIDFNVLVDNLISQTFDAVLLFWGFGFPADPDSDVRTTFSPANDVPGSGFNVTSYNNPELMALLDQANTVPGCDQEIRGDLYNQVFQILRDDAPWVWLSTALVMVAVQPDVQNFDPRPGSTFWNEDAYILPEMR